MNFQKNRAGDWSTDGIQVSGCSSMSASSAEGAPKRTESCKESHPSNLHHVFDEQSWLSHHARIQLKILTLTVKTHRRLAPKCFGLIQPPLTAHSVPSNRLDLLVPSTQLLLWFSLDSLPQLVPPFGKRLLLLALQFCRL